MSKGRLLLPPLVVVVVSCLLLLLLLPQPLVEAAALADNAQDAGQCLYVFHFRGIDILNQVGSVVKSVPIYHKLSYKAVGDPLNENIYVKTFQGINKYVAPPPKSLFDQMNALSV